MFAPARGEEKRRDRRRQEMYKQLENNKVTFLTTGALVVAVILVFLVYTWVNQDLITRQNATYIENTAIQCAERVSDLLNNAKYSINTLARLYSNAASYGNGAADLAELQGMADRSVFDYVNFITPDGKDINAQGRYASVGDRTYYIMGMRGESGIDGAYLSRITGERVIVFYAPVYYQNEIIGVLVGHYLEARLNDIIHATLFGEQVASFLCRQNGIVISSAGADVEDYDLADYLEDSITLDEYNALRTAIADGESFSFSCQTSSGQASAYLAPLPDTDWSLLQIFPASVLAQMQERVNGAGIVLEVELISLFLLYLLLLLTQHMRQKRRLISEKEEAEQIVDGINRLFTQCILVNLEQDTYRYVNTGQTDSNPDRAYSPGFRTLPLRGSYAKLLHFYGNWFVPNYGVAPLEHTLSPEEVRRCLSPQTPFQRFEYQWLRRREIRWETIAVIGLKWQDNQPTTILLAVQDMTELKLEETRTRNALKEACQAAESANRAKSDFLSRMSHDIRTPMNGIVGMTAIAAMHLDDTARVADCLNKITSSSRHLLGLINEVLDMSKIESGKLELMNEEFELPEMVDGLVGIFQPQVEAKHQSFSVTLSGVVHEKVIGDSQRLSQVLVNIMGNAVKFTPEGGSISLHIHEIPAKGGESGCYEFTVTDTGIGMDESFVQRMFEPFSRAADSRTEKTEGTGLGMTIARTIVRMMNGDIQVKSKKGQGTSITASVYLRYQLQTETDLRSLAGHRVMVVDDSEVACEHACNTLASINVEADGFTDGEKALQALTADCREGKNSYKAVILDWHMPQKDGLQMAQEIRAAVGSSLPLIIASAYDWSAIEQKATEAGINAFIAKPMFRSRLIYVMKQVLNGSEMSSAHEHEEVEQPALPVKEEHFSNQTILVVEDNELNMEIAYELLTMAGFSVEQTVNGKEAVDRLLREPPGTFQLVLMDIQMPIMNGYQATMAIRSSGRPDLETLPIIAMTADAFSDDVQKATAAGMNGHISKPIDVDKLMAMLGRWLKQ